MLKRFKLYKKWSDYLNVNNSEVRISLIITCIFVLLYFWLDIYNYMSDICVVLSDFILCMIAGYFGLLGFALSGIAIVTALFSKDVHDLINAIHGEGRMEKLMCSFEFLAFNVALGIILNIVVFFSLMIPVSIVKEGIFPIIYAVYVYFTVFIIFYTVALVGNCIKLYELKNIYSNADKHNKDFKIDANEIRIDYILYTLVKNNVIDKDTFIKDISDEILNYSSSEHKEDIKEYFCKRYGYKG